MSPPPFARLPVDRRSVPYRCTTPDRPQSPWTDGFRQQLAANRAQFYRDIASGPFYGYNRPGAKVSQAVIENWRRQGMMGGAKAHYDGIRAFSETDFTEDLKIIDVPTLVMHGSIS